MRRSLQWLIQLAAVLLAACTTGPTQTPDDQDLPLKLGRIQSLQRNGVSVQVSIPTDDEVSRMFGVPLAKHDIQPIWIKIDNASDVDYWLMPIAAAVSSPVLSSPMLMPSGAS